MKKRNILFLVSRLGIGGIQTFVIKLANYLVTNNPNLKVGIYCHIPEYANLKSNLSLDRRIQIYTITKNPLLIRILNVITSFIKKLNPEYSLKEYLSTIYYNRLVKENRVDLIHSNIYLTDRLAINSKIKYSIPFITTSHGSYDEDSSTEVKIKLMQELALGCDMYVYMAQKNLANFQRNKIVIPRLQFIPYGFDSSYPRNLQNSIANGGAGVKFCMIARGAIDKGWIQLHDAISLLHQQNLRFEMHVAADGQLVKQLFGNRETENIYYYGPVTDSLPIIEKCNVGLLPTYHQSETMPFTVIEYLYHGKPVISTDLGSIKYMITYKESIAGEILSYRSNGIDVNELAEAMKMYIIDKNKLMAKSCLAALAFEKFDMGICAENYLDLYRKILEK